MFDETIYSLRVRNGIEKGEELPDEIVNKGQSALELINLADSKEKNPFMLSGGEKRRLSVVSRSSLDKTLSY